LFLGVGVYLLAEWFFRISGVEKLMYRFLGNSSRIGRDPLPKAIGKYLAVFVFLIYLRRMVMHLGYTEVENFIGSVVDYFPHLLLALLITFFGIQSSGTAYSFLYNILHFDDPRTAVVVGNIARVIILFFTFTVALSLINKIGDIEIIPEYLIRSLLIGFVAATSLAFGLAFGLGGRHAAKEIIAQYLQKSAEKITVPEKDHEKKLEK
jgi:hypothetical protein